MSSRYCRLQGDIFLFSFFVEVGLFDLCERAFRSRFTLRKEGQVELPGGETPKQLSAARYCENFRNAVNAFFRRENVCFSLPTRQRKNDLRDQTHRALVYRPLQFRKRSQDFFGANNETLPVAMRVHNPDCSLRPSLKRSRMTNPLAKYLSVPLAASP